MQIRYIPKSYNYEHGANQSGDNSYFCRRSPFLLYYREISFLPMSCELSPMEYAIAEQYCHGLTDKEVAAVLDKPVWTIRTHKKHIHGKLGISTTHELVLYMVALWCGRAWDVRALRQRGLAAVLGLLLLCLVAVVGVDDMSAAACISFAWLIFYGRAE